MDDAREFEPEGDELHDWEYPDADHDDDEDELDLVECPMCGCDVYEESEQCPLCGEFLLRERTTVWDNKPVLWIVLGILGVISTLIALAVYPTP